MVVVDITQRTCHQDILSVLALQLSLMSCTTIFCEQISLLVQKTDLCHKDVFVLRFLWIIGYQVKTFGMFVTLTLNVSKKLRLPSYMPYTPQRVILCSVRCFSRRHDKSFVLNANFCTEDSLGQGSNSENDIPLVCWSSVI